MMAASAQKIEALDAQAFEKAVYAAILRALGPAGLVRYMREHLSGPRDYTAERQQWVASRSHEQLMDEWKALDLEAIQRELLDDPAPDADSEDGIGQ